MNIATLTFTAIRAEIARYKKNIGTRAERIQEAGFDTDALQSFELAKRAAKPQTRNEALKQLSELRRIDQNKGTRMKTAAAQERSDFRRRELDLTRAELKNNPRSLPPKRRVDELYKSELSKARSRAARVKEKFGSSHATDIFDEWLAERTLNPTARTKAMETRRLMLINEYEGMSLTGMKQQNNRGVKAFGPEYSEWDRKHQNAAWVGFRELVEATGATVSSDQILADLQFAASKSRLNVAFYEGQESDGMGGKRSVLKASVREHMDSAQIEASRREYSERKMREAHELTQRMLGGNVLGTLNNLF